MSKLSHLPPIEQRLIRHYSELLGEGFGQYRDNRYERLQDLFIGRMLLGIERYGGWKEAGDSRDMVSEASLELADCSAYLAYEGLYGSGSHTRSRSLVHLQEDVIACHLNLIWLPE